jgi:transposase-like protein
MSDEKVIDFVDAEVLPKEDVLLTIKELAKKYNVHTSTIYRWLHTADVEPAGVKLNPQGSRTPYFESHKVSHFENETRNLTDLQPIGNVAIADVAQLSGVLTMLSTAIDQLNAKLRAHDEIIEQLTQKAEKTASKVAIAEAQAADASSLSKLVEKTFIKRQLIIEGEIDKLQAPHLASLDRRVTKMESRIADVDFTLSRLQHGIRD